MGFSDKKYVPPGSQGSQTLRNKLEHLFFRLFYTFFYKKPRGKEMSWSLEKKNYNSNMGVKISKKIFFFACGAISERNVRILCKQSLKNGEGVLS